MTGRWASVASFRSTRSSKLVTTTIQDTSKATLSSNVSCHLIRAPSTSRTHTLDSMHACLNVDEIVRLIACELVASGGKGTAVALACCSKSFEDPVLDGLWKTQDRLIPLFKSFPGDIWNGDGCTVSAPTVSFRLFLTTQFESPSKDSQRRPSGLVSENTLEGCESSEKIALKTSCLWKRSGSSNSVPSTNPY